MKHKLAVGAFLLTGLSFACAARAQTADLASMLDTSDMKMDSNVAAAVSADQAGAVSEPTVKRHRGGKGKHSSTRKHSARGHYKRSTGSSANGGNHIGAIGGNSSSDNSCCANTGGAM